MFAVLGDREKQQKIRDESPDDPHCNDLMISAQACDGCKFSPQSIKSKQKESVQPSMDLVTWAIRLVEYSTVGLLRPIDKISSREAVAVRIALAHYMHNQQKRLAKMIGIEVGKVVGELMATMFARKTYG